MFVKLSRTNKAKFNQKVKLLNSLTNALVTRPMSDFEKIEVELHKAQKDLDEFLKPYGLNLDTRHLVR